CVAYDEGGQLLTATLMDYAVPRADDLLEPEIGHLETPSPVMPGGVKGMGEGGTIGAPAAIANAVADAVRHLGVRITALPIRPESLLRRPTPPPPWMRSRGAAARHPTRRHEDLEKMGKQDIEIARAVKLQPIQAIGEMLGLNGNDLEPYGTYKAKIRWDVIERTTSRPDGTLVLVTAMTPTPAGEGKSTTTIGLADGLRRLGKRSIVAMREPSLGPVFGVKGGGTGGGHTQVAPMEDITLHFTGDMHAIGAAHNLLAAMIDNHLAQGNSLNLDSRRIVWRRVMDMNDRALRRLVIGLGGTAHGVPRETGFDITVASEIMAILCLARDLQDFKARVERVVVADRGDGPFVTARELKAAGAMTVLMKDTIKPNLVQTLDGTPAFVHGGPFANIAHGCNSLIATRLALKLGEFVVTEAGFASDLGAEKFVDIKCRTGGLKPAAAVIVTTTRALATHGEE